MGSSGLCGDHYTYVFVFLFLTEFLSSLNVARPELHRFFLHQPTTTTTITTIHNYRARWCRRPHYNGPTSAAVAAFSHGSLYWCVTHTHQCTNTCGSPMCNPIVFVYSCSQRSSRLRCHSRWVIEAVESSRLCSLERRGGVNGGSAGAPAVAGRKKRTQRPSNRTPSVVVASLLFS